MKNSTESDLPDALARWNLRFESDDYLFGTEPNAWLREKFSPRSPGERVLCVADGEGRNSVWLARQGLVVNAFDISEAAVSKARRLAAKHGVVVNFAIGDCDSYGWSEKSYDYVIAIFVQFANPESRERMFRNMVRCLKPGGVLFLLGYTLKQLDYRTGGPSEPSHLYSEALLREAFADCDIVELREYEAELDEGAGHRGQSALIGLVAKKGESSGRPQY